MKAYIYNDAKGEDISIVDIPDDMIAEAEEARSQLIRSTAFDCMFDYSTGLWQEGPAYFLWFHDLLLHPHHKPVYF